MMSWRTENLKKTIRIISQRREAKGTTRLNMKKCHEPVILFVLKFCFVSSFPVLF